jgi:hypothetical protein
VRKPEGSPLQEARRQILAEARRQPWARDDVGFRYVLADWIRRQERAADELRRVVTASAHGGVCEGCWSCLERAAQRETLALAVETDVGLEASWRRA